MVRSEEDLLVCHPQADLTRGMAGGSDDLQGIFPTVSLSPVLQGLVIGQVRSGPRVRAELVPVVITRSSGESPPGETAGQCGPSIPPPRPGW